MRPAALGNTALGLAASLERGAVAPLRILHYTKPTLRKAAAFQVCLGGITMTRSPSRRPLAILGAALLSLLPLVACSADASSLPACVDEDRALNYGFYAFFEPLSYSLSEDPASPDFNSHRGYEADLLTALESLEGPNLAFSRSPIEAWDGIWLLPSTGRYDVVGGGITILDSRTRDASGNEAVRFTSGHVGFRQSLLVRAGDAQRLASYDSLTSSVRVGALAGTTGEARVLQIVGLADSQGVLAAGARVETPQGEVVADGSADFFITSAGESANLAGRSLLHPPSDSMPQIVYLGSEAGENELLQALADGDIDAVARGEIGNLDATRAAVRDYGVDFAVTALDDAVELGGFTLAAGDAELASCIDENVNRLTNNRAIGYKEWLDNPSVFMERAATVNRES